MFSTRSVLYPNYPWTERVRKLAKKMYVDNGGKMDAEANYYEPWAMYGKEACRIIELKKEKLREERKILKDAAKKSKSAIPEVERLEKQEEEMNKITVEEIKRLDAERSQGDWQLHKFTSRGDDYYNVSFDNEWGKVAGNLYDECGIISENNAAFIAAAPRIAAMCIEQEEELSLRNDSVTRLSSELNHITELYEQVINEREDFITTSAKEVALLRADNERLRGALEICEDIFSRKAGLDEEDSGYHACKKALAQSAAPAKEDKTNGGWLSIESAPDSGESILLYDGYCYEGCWDELDYNEFYGKPVMGWNYGCAEIDPSNFSPTHWKPLGELPAQPLINEKQG